MTSEDRIEQSLRTLGGERPQPPPLDPALEAALGDLKPVSTRRPGRQFAAVGLLSLLYGGFLLLMLELRPDLEGLPTLWLVLYCAAWLASFLLITWVVMVPGRGHVMPNWRYAGAGAVVASVGFVAAGLLFNRGVPGVSVFLEPSLHDFVRHGRGCLIMGSVTSLVPVALACLLLRGSVPVGSRWTGAGIGAAGGSLGGLMLHLHCPVADALHLGVIHGGVVAVGAAIGALVLPRATRR